MVYRRPDAGPASRIDSARRGPVVGIFCLGCGSVYPLFSSHHRGKPVFGKDHVASPCSHEGKRFAEGAGWWEPAVEVLPPVPDGGEERAAEE